MASRRTTSVQRTATIIAAMVLLFKAIGFIKQAVIAYYFGATQQSDIFFLASGFIAGITQAIVHTLSVATLSVYTQVRIKEGREKASELISAIITTILPISLLIVTIIQLLAPQIAHILAPSYSLEQSLDLQFFLRLMSFTFLFSAFELICGAVLDSEKDFTLPRLQSLFLSIFIIASCIYLSRQLSIYSIAIGQYAANITYTFVLVFGIRKYIKFKPVAPWNCKPVFDILKLTVPLLFGNGMIQLNQIVDKSISTGLGEGVVSSLAYCHVLSQFVTSVMVVNISNVLFSYFSEYVASNEIDRIRTTLITTLNTLVYILTPISIITIICSVDIVKIVYYRGDFTLDAVYFTAIALSGYAISFVCVGIRDILAKSMYAYKDTKSPMINGSLSICINIVMSIILSKYIGILGIALGTTIATIVTMALNMHSFKKKLPVFSFKPLLFAAAKSIPSILATTVVVIVIKQMCSNSHIRFVSATIFGFSTYYLLLYLTGAQEIRSTVNNLRRKITVGRSDSEENKIRGLKK